MNEQIAASSSSILCLFVVPSCPVSLIICPPLAKRSAGGSRKEGDGEPVVDPLLRVIIGTCEAASD